MPNPRAVTGAFRPSRLAVAVLLALVLAACGWALASAGSPAGVLLQGPASARIAENDYGRVATYAAPSEAGPSGVRWSLRGPDAAHFTIDAPPGVLRLRIAPAGPGRLRTAADYENPRDVGRDNTYEVTVVATAPGGERVDRAVAVTVTDADEAGTISLSSAHPRAGELLRAVVSDPDAVEGAVYWSWERSAGRNAWAPIEDAPSAAYVPTAADAGEFLRVTAEYADRHGSGKTVVRALHHVVAADVLSSLAVSTGDSAAGKDWRRQRPAFEARTLHYSVGCADADSMTLTFAAASAASRLAVDGVAYPNPGPGIPVTATVAVGGSSDVVVSVSNAGGGETRYVVHCLHERLDPFRTETAAGATEQLLLVARNEHLLILDRHGVPRWRLELSDAEAQGYFRFHPDAAGGEYRYSYSLREGRHVVLDENLDVVDEVTTVEPLTHTATHDFRVLPGGDYLLLSFEEAVRDFSRLTFPGADGEPYGTETPSTDSAIQLVTPEGEALWTWNSYDHLPLEDCTHHWFPPADPRWSHINAVGVFNGELVVSSRGCNTVLGLDPDTREVNWRVGPTNQDEPGWASPPLDPAPLAIAGDPEGQFCAQHGAQLTPEGRLLLYDNGGDCSRNPWTGENLVRPDRTYSRAVEYQLDFANGEAVYVRERSLGGGRDRIGWFGGHIEELEGGDWLVSWGSELPDIAWPRPPWPAHELATASQIDPETGAERLRLHWPHARGHDIRVTAMPAWALARQPQTLSASLETASTSGSHAGEGDRPQVVVSFDQPVRDFGPGSPSFSVEGAELVSVAPRIAQGEPAWSYTLTLAPHGERAIRFALLTNQPCDAGGICAADGTPLTGLPPAFEIAARDCR